jgi:MoaA/NifB/PqqE/SkfB family radical SAM enzyme
MSLLQNQKTKSIGTNNPTYIMQGQSSTKSLDTYHLIFAPTHACNLRCHHCYLPNHDVELIPEDVALKVMEDWSDMVLAERGQYGGIFHIKGGEPFVVPYFWSLIDRITELKNLRLMMTTNGTLCDETTLQKLQSCNKAIDGNMTIVVSLDGATEATHSILRGKGNFGKTLKFIEGLQKNKINFYLNCVLHSENIDEISAYLDLAEKFGAGQVNFLTFVPRGIGEGFSEFQLPHLTVYNHLKSLFDSSDERMRNLLAGSLPYIKWRESSGHSNTSHECVASYRGMLYITPEGNAYTCPNMVNSKFALGNIYKDSVRDISDSLKSLFEIIKKDYLSYQCVGENLLYQATENSNNILSLDRLTSHLVESSVQSNHTDSLAYCHSRNW